MLSKNIAMDDDLALLAGRELARGMATISGFAVLCSRAVAGLCRSPVELGRQAEAILACAADRGLIELRMQTDRIDSSERLLAVTIEMGENTRRTLRKKSDPAWTMEFLEGFRRLCLNGLVMHLAGSEFVLTSAGFGLARGLDATAYAAELEGAQDEEI